MRSFVQRFAGSILGMLTGFDRLRLRGTKRLLASARGLASYLWQQQILWKDFPKHAEAITAALRQATESQTQQTQRPLVYVAGPATDKEALAQQIAQRDGITRCLVCVLTSPEVFSSFVLYRNRDTRKLELRPQTRKCLHYYHYLIDPQWGWCHVRVQTWFTFNLHVVLNGREWLARQLQAAGLGYERRDNCLVAVADIERAQELFDQELGSDWAAQRKGLAGRGWAGGGG